MSDDFEDVKVLCEFYKRVFIVAGVWPLDPTNVTFLLWVIYCSIQASLNICKLTYLEAGLEWIMGAGEFTWVAIVIPKLLVLRFSRKLPILLRQILDEINDKSFPNVEEKELYLIYSRIAKSFWVALGSLTLAGVIMHYFKPLIFLLTAVFVNNESVPHITPFRTHLMFEVNDYYTLSAWWIYQIPMMAVNAFHPLALAFVLFIIFHTCGQLSGLSNRIRNMDVAIGASVEDAAATFRDIVERHRTILGKTTDINDVFNVLMLEELFATTVMIIFTLHTVVCTSDFSKTGDLLAYASYTALMFILIYGYCAAGEYLILESSQVCEAYYQCQWYDLPDSCQKQLIICMIGASKPVHLLGGGFYIYSLSSFADILKTVLSYVSLLRTLM